MREAPAIPIIERLLAARRRRSARTIRRRRRSARRHLRRPHHALREELRRAARRRRAGDRHRVERVPRAGLREDAVADEGAGRLRRPQHLLARADARARLHLLLHWPLTRARVLVTGGAGYIGSHAAKALQPRRLPRRRLRQPGRRPPRGGQVRRARRRRHRRRRGRPRRAAAPRHLRRDALRGVSRRRRVGARAGHATTATTSSAR